MPELPDIAAYISALEPRVVGRPLEHVRLASAFLLRTVEPPIANVEGHTVRELRRVGKRIAFGFDNDLWLVLHLMIAGRLHWRPQGAKLAVRSYSFRNRLKLLTWQETARALPQKLQRFLEEKYGIFTKPGMDLRHGLDLT